MTAASLRAGATNGVILVAALLLLCFVLSATHSPYWLVFAHPMTVTVGFVAAVALAVIPLTARWGKGLQPVIAFAIAGIPMVLVFVVINLNHTQLPPP